ncbi:MAG: heptaprenyl diphosphate synthase [Betaproteobacteria bacterium HGW-Betaproteobacteria-2]|jgi:heptaprenyl diphosphate synthase|nr:MAG: heptaprenyl diphosphate synthase [Betaproteobacteria bacterium HGW-Betaproteobacteria-2]
MRENTRHTITATENDHRIAKLAALAIGLHLIEAVLPSPLPGVKPGIANIVTLYVLYHYGIGTATWVSLLRVFAGSLLLGQLFSPTFLLSFGGALGSLAVLALAIHLPKQWFGPVSLSILAAFAHISGQLLIVWLWLIPHSGIVYLTPVFALAALVFGLINGLVLTRLMQQN